MRSRHSGSQHALQLCLFGVHDRLAGAVVALVGHHQQRAERDQHHEDHDTDGLNQATDEVLDLLLDQRNSRRSADQNDFVDFRGRETGIRERLATGFETPFHQVFDQLLELRARELEREVLGTALVGGDVREIDVRALRRREFVLRLFGGFAQALQRHRILGEIQSLLPLEFGD